MLNLLFYILLQLGLLESPSNPKHVQVLQKATPTIEELEASQHLDKGPIDITSCGDGTGIGSGGWDDKN